MSRALVKSGRKPDIASAKAHEALMDVSLPNAMVEAIPALLRLSLPNAQMPRSHERVTRLGLDELVGHTAASEWMRFRLARHG